MDAGQLVRRITIESPTVAGSNFGKNGVATWAAYASNVPAKIEYAGGGEVDSSNQRQGESYVKFIIRRNEELNIKMRVVYAGSNYGIERVAEHPFGHRMFTEIYARLQK